MGQSHVGRYLKVIYVEDEDNIYLKSAYEATPEVKRIFAKYHTNKPE